MSLPWRTIAGGWYGAMSANGAYAVQVPFQTIRTDRGEVDRPDGEPWGVQIYDIADDGRFAGLAHSTNGTTLEYVPGAGWRSLPYVTGRGKYVGTHWVDLSPAGTGFVDDSGTPISRILTYEPNRGLSNWIGTDGLLFGQGNTDKGAPCEGLLLWDGTAYRQLFNGSCMELVLHRDGDLFAFAFREDGVGVHLGIFTRQQLLAEPIVSTPPPPPDEPPIDPPPQPESRMKLPADVHSTFTACVQKFPHDGDDDQRREAMKKAVQTIRSRHGLRYVWKSEHSNLSSPSKDGMGFVPLEEGAIHEGERRRMFIWDMINGTTRQPNEAGESEPIREAYVLTPEPKDWLAGTNPPPDVPPQPPSPDVIASLRAEIAELRTTQRKHDADLGRIDAAALRLADRVEQLEHKPDPVPQPQPLPKLRVRGSTSRAFGHGHTIDLPVVQE